MTSSEAGTTSPRLHSLVSSVPVGISLDRKLLERIDRERGDCPRSKFVSRLIEKSLLEEKTGPIELIARPIELIARDLRGLLTPLDRHFDELGQLLDELDSERGRDEEQTSKGGSEE